MSAPPIPPGLLAAPDQGAMIRMMALPADTAQVPVDAQYQCDYAAVPVAGETGLEFVLLPRPDAVAFIEAEREMVRRGGRQALDLEWDRCRSSRVWFIGRWVNISTKLPVNGSRSVPFTLFPYQVRATRLYDRARAETKGLFQDKSRQLGFSWLIMAWLLHGVLFEEDFSGVVTHQTEDDVDDGGSKSTVNSLLGRLRFMYEALDPFLMNDPDRGTPALDIKFRLIRNPHRNGFLSGEPSGANVARGGSVRVWLADEWAHAPFSESAWASANEAVECPILNSTSFGRTNHFGRTHLALTKPRNRADEIVRDRFLVNRAHWSMHPVYSIGIHHDGEGRLTSPYYEKASGTLLPDLAAMEYDISYERSLPGRFFPEFVYSVHVPEEPIPLRPGWWFYMVGDHGLADTEVWGLYQTDGQTAAEKVDEWHTVPQGHRTGLDLRSDQVAEGLWAWLGRHGLTVWDMAFVIGDPSGANRDQTSGQSHHQLLRATWRDMAPIGENGRRREPPPITHANNDFEAGVASVRMLFRGTYDGRPFLFRISPICTLTIESVQNYRRRVNRNGVIMPDEEKDWTNHACDEVRYFVHTVFPAIGTELEEEHRPRGYTAAARGRRIKRR